MFVLPANVYPAPPPPPEPTLDPQPDSIALQEAAEDEPRRAAEVGAPGDTDLLHELAAESGKLTRKAKREKEARLERREKAKEEAEKNKAKKAKEKKAAQENPLIAREPLGRRLRRVFSPFRLIVASVLAVIVATVSWQIHSRNIDSARLRFDTARKDAMKLLEENKFVEAEPVLNNATAAANLVGRQDAIANRVRRLALEVNVLNNLSQTSMYEAVATATLASGDDMSTVLMAQLGDRWIALDTYVIRRNETPEGSEYTVEIPLLVNDVLVEAVVITDAFDKLELPKSGGQVAFAAKIDSCSVRRKDDRDRLLIRLADDSVRLWANPMTYAALGFGDAEPPNYLEDQAIALGVSE